MSEEVSLKIRIFVSLIAMAAFVALALACGAGCATASGAIGPGRPANFECWLHEHLDGSGKCLAYRGGQPTLQQLQAIGAAEVIKLNTALEGRDALPVGVIEDHHPWSPVGPVSHEDIAAALFDLEHAERPTYVHCTHGVDRTGLLIAVYRVKVQGVPAPAAWAEWRRFPREVTDRLFLYQDFERETGYHIPEDER